MPALQAQWISSRPKALRHHPPLHKLGHRRHRSNAAARNPGRHHAPVAIKRSLAPAARMAPGACHRPFHRLRALCKYQDKLERRTVKLVVHLHLVSGLPNPPACHAARPNSHACLGQKR